MKSSFEIFKYDLVFMFFHKMQTVKCDSCNKFGSIIVAHLGLPKRNFVTLFQIIVGALSI